MLLAVFKLYAIFVPGTQLLVLISPPLIVLLDWARAGGGFTEKERLLY